MNTLQTGKLIIILGVVIIVIGGGVYLAGRFNIPLGRLPGDFRIQRENFTFFFPFDDNDPHLPAPHHRLEFAEQVAE
jgi:hypothetical protein